MHRMQREQCGDESASPKSFRYPAQKEKQQKRVGNMKPHAFQMVGARVEAE